MSTPNWGDVRMQGKRTGNSKDPVEEVDSSRRRKEDGAKDRGPSVPYVV